MTEQLPPERLHPEFQTFVDALAAARVGGAPAWDELTAQELRTFTQDIRKASAPVAGLTTRELKVDGATGPLPARLYVPSGSAEPGPGLVYFHGGGFSIGSIDTHDSIVARLAAASGAKILSVDYRLAPEHRFPAAHDDAVASSRWAFDNAATIGFDRDRIGIGGDSAGANLAGSTCLDMRGDSDRTVAFQLLIYPNTTIEGTSGSRATYAEGHYLTLAAAQHLFRQYIDAHDACDPRIDLLHRIDLAGLPSTFFSVGHCDILFDECIEYAMRLERAGVATTLRTYPGYIHGFLGFSAQVPTVSRAFEDAGKAMRAALGMDCR